MPGRGWKVVHAVRRGDWRSKLIAIAQVAVGLVALLGLVGMLTRSPLFLLGFSAAQGLILVGVILFVIVAAFAQRTLVLEQFDPGEVIFREGDTGDMARHVYVIRSGAVEVLVKRPDGSQEVIKRLGTDDHFGEMALLRNVPRNATIRTVTAVEVFKMSPGSFTALYTNLPGFREHFSRVMEERLRELGGLR
jgi:hypothetical protein